MNIAYLRELLTLSECLNYTKAAKRLGISQPSLSKHVATAEKELGFKIFEVEKQKVSITPWGKVFLKRVRRIVLEYDSLVEQMKTLKGQRPQSLSVTTFLGHRLLHDALRLIRQDFSERYPLLEITLSDVQPYATLADRLLNVETDLAILPLRNFEGLESYERRLLYREPLVAIVPVSDPLARKPKLSARDLDSETVWIASQPGDRRFVDSMRELLSQGGITPHFKERLWSDYDELNAFDFSDGVYVGCKEGTLGNMSVLTSADYVSLPFEDDDLFFWACALWVKGNRNEAIPLVLDELQRQLTKMGYSYKEQE